MGAGHHHHGAGHGHHHHHHSREKNKRRLLITLALTASFMVAEVIGGVVTGSLALLADAGHMLSDVAALALSVFAIWMARRPPTSRRTYGYYRMEILAALVNGAALIAISVFIFMEAYERLSDPPEVQGGLMMVIAAGGLLINLAALAILHRGREENLNIRGAYLHVLTDALGSIGALLAGGAILAFGWYWADPAISAVIGTLVIYSSWNLLRQAVAVLMEGAPHGIDVDEVRTSILEVAGVEEVHDLHIWSITSGMDSLSAHVVVDDAAHHYGVLSAVRKTVHDRFGIDHVTVQIEPRGFEEHRLAV